MRTGPNSSLDCFFGSSVISRLQQAKSSVAPSASRFKSGLGHSTRRRGLPRSTRSDRIRPVRKIAHAHRSSHAAGFVSVLLDARHCMVGVVTNGKELTSECRDSASIIVR
jgi:hypothetical protein